MSDELQQQLAELIKLLIASAKDAGTWATSQIPPLIQEKIWFGRISSTLIVVICAVAVWRLSLVASAFYAEARADQMARSSQYDPRVWMERPGGMASIVSLIGCGVLTIIGAVNTYDALLAWVAPRLYIVNWLLSLR